MRASQRRADAAEILQEKARIVRDLHTLENEAVAKAERMASSVAVEKKERAAQVEANRARIARTAAHALAEDRERLRQQMEDDDKAAEAKQSKAAAKKRELQKTQEDNKVWLAIKAREQEAARLRDIQMQAWPIPPLNPPFYEPSPLPHFLSSSTSKPLLPLRTSTTPLHTTGNHIQVTTHL